MNRYRLDEDEQGRKPGMMPDPEGDWVPFDDAQADVAACETQHHYELDELTKAYNYQKREAMLQSDAQKQMHEREIAELKKKQEAPR